MFRVVSPLVVGRENTKHWTPFVLPRILMQRSEPVVYCVFPDCHGPDSFKLPKPNPDAEVQAVTTESGRTWLFVREPLRQTSMAVSARLYNL